MHSLDQTIDYLFAHWWIAVAIIVWTGAASHGIGEALAKWKFRRVMRRNAELHKDA